MKIVADENIPFIEHYFANAGELILKPGRDISHADLVLADMLLVRSVTKVNKDLLDHTQVKFVGSTTTGADHIDTAWLDKVGIDWSVAQGCNAIAVVEYVVAVTATLQQMGFLMQEKPRVAVIGVGHIGSMVADELQGLGFDVVLCDPLRLENEPQFKGFTLDEIKDVDLITLHTPLTKTGPYPTYHLIEKEFLQRQKQNCVLLNTSRGSVIDFNDLKIHGEHLIWCLDVWENEPIIDLDVLEQAVIATPHIAGYSLQAKYRGIQMIYDALLKKQLFPFVPVPPKKFPTQDIFFAGAKVDWRDVVLRIYDPFKTTQLMKARLVENLNAFDELRKNFIDRHEFGFVRIEDVSLSLEDKRLLDSLLRAQ